MKVEDIRKQVIEARLAIEATRDRELKQKWWTKIVLLRQMCPHPERERIRGECSICGKRVSE